MHVKLQRPLTGFSSSPRKVYDDTRPHMHRPSDLAGEAGDAGR